MQNKRGLTITELEKDYQVFEINDVLEDFQRIEIEDEPLYRILKPSSIFLFIDSGNKKVWLWNGRHADIRKKFIASQSVPKIRDKFCIDYHIATVDDGKEDLEFKVLVGLD
ncbi:MAG: hypothetical protein ACFE85_07655 [Candidatus Hodarchaeota archaeon]